MERPAQSIEHIARVSDRTEIHMASSLTTLPQLYQLNSHDPNGDRSGLKTNHFNNPHINSNHLSCKDLNGDRLNKSNQLGGSQLKGQHDYSATLRENGTLHESLLVNMSSTGEICLLNQKTNTRYLSEMRAFNNSGRLLLRPAIQFNDYSVQVQITRRIVSNLSGWPSKQGCWQELQQHLSLGPSY